MRLSVIMILSLLASRAYAAPEIVVEDPSKKLPSSTLDLVRQATEQALARLPETPAAKCAFRSSWRGVPGKDAWAKEMGFME